MASAPRGCAVEEACVLAGGQEGSLEEVFKLGWRCLVGVSGPGTACPSLEARELVCSWK